MTVEEIIQVLKGFDEKAELEVLSDGKVIGFACQIGGDKETPYMEVRKLVK